MASLSSMEPLLPEEQQKDLEDLATDLVAKSNALSGGLHPVIRAGVGNLVRSMNCYYSNLIEGHNTLPVDIERALAGDFAQDKNKRDLQLEARAHIDVQRMIDRGEAPAAPVSQDFILWVHKEFCGRMPADLLIVENPDSHEKAPVVPGELRNRHVKVGAHIPPDPSDLSAFLLRFAEAYSGQHLCSRMLGCANWAWAPKSGRCHAALPATSPNTSPA
jgi:Fic family protein